jgi:hypothetical protein
VSDAKTATLVVTPKGMLSYPHLAEPQQPKNGKGKPKYSATVVFAPGTDLATLQAAVFAAAEEKFGTKGAEMLRTGALKSPFRKDAEAKGYPAGSIFINARTERQPGLVYLHAGSEKDASGRALPARIPAEKIRDDLYPGCFVRVQLRAFFYDTEGNKGISFALNNVQKLADGERIDGRQDATDAFDADLSAAPADISALTNAGLI